MRKPLKLKSDYINLLLDVAAQRTRERGDLAYERSLGLPLRDVRLLRLIGGKPGVVMGELAEVSGIEKTLASKIIGALVQRGFVVRHIGQKDARQIHLELSDEGANLVRLAEPLGVLMERGFEQWLSPVEMKTLRTTLQKVIDAEHSSRHQFNDWLEQLSGAVVD